MYVPLNMIDVQDTMRRLRVVYEEQDETASVMEQFKDTGDYDPEAKEILCYDLSRNGYIGVPRAWGMQRLRLQVPAIDFTTKRPRTPELFVRNIKPRDLAQKDFMDALVALCKQSGPVDFVANAKTGTGKTISALYTVENGIQAPTLISVPTNYLLNQWRERIKGTMGREWFEQYVGHLQQNTVDVDGRLIVLAVAASLARRDYGDYVRSYFEAVLFDEFHRIGTPSMEGILATYPSRIRGGFTATNRGDAMRKVCDLHLGPPRIISKQKVLRPHVYRVQFEATAPRDMEVYNERQMVSYLAKLRARNYLLADIIYHRGYKRNRQIVALSDRTFQLMKIGDILLEYGVPDKDVGLLVGQYEWQGKKITMKRHEQDYVAKHCQIRLATYGLFAEGSDIDVLDMGIECTPRENVKQAVGRVLRILQGKEAPEWYSIDDLIRVYGSLDQAADLFAPNTPSYYKPIMDMTEHRQSSYKFQDGIVSTLDPSTFLRAA